MFRQRPLFQNLKLCFVQQVRTMRTKPGHRLDFYTRAQSQDERLLKRLEAQLDRATAKLAKETEEAERMMKMQEQSIGKDGEEDYNTFFWEIVLSSQDRAILKKNNIYNFADLYTLHKEAETVMEETEQNTFEDLDDRHRVAYEMFKSIPEKISGRGTAKWKLS